MKSLKDKILSMRYNEFGFSKVHFFGSDKDVFPNKIHIVKWVVCDEPYEAISTKDGKKHKYYTYNYAIGELEWDVNEPRWDFRSIGTRYLEDGDVGLNKWILDFCEKYEVCDGEIKEVKR